MSLYVVVKTGVYRHEIKGVFTADRKAIDAAVFACRDEIDDYHDFIVLRYESDEPVKDGSFVCKVRRNTPIGYSYKASYDAVKWLRAIYADDTVEEFDYE